MPSPTRKASKASASAPTETGTFIFPNGEKYEGEYVRKPNGSIQRHGIGAHHTKEGTVYSGAWVNDTMSGMGEVRHSSGLLYKGEFSNGQYNGSGVLSWPNEGSFSGNFVNNRITGEGLYTDNTGRTWVGDFSGKQPQGLVLKIY